MRDSAHKLAREGEDLATAWLEEHGYAILDRNYRFGHGEIDIIATDGEYTVFVEVKTRANSNFGSAAAAVPASKQRQLLRVARGYMFEQQADTLLCRFDVMAVEIRGHSRIIEHFPHAFMEMP